MHARGLKKRRMAKLATGRGQSVGKRMHVSCFDKLFVFAGVAQEEIALPENVRLRAPCR